VAGAHTDAQSARPEPRWYGWQVALSDGAALAFGLGFLEAGRAVNDIGAYPGLAYTGGGLYLVGGPLVHLANGRYWASGGSLLLRAAMPVFFASVGCPPPGRDERCTMTFTGIFVGAAVAAVLDAGLLGWKPETPAKKEQSFSPTFSIARGGMTLGLVGAF